MPGIGVRTAAVFLAETLVQAHPLYQVLTSMPGIGVRTAAVFLAETLGKTFDTGAQLASYAGLAPVTRRSGSSICGEVHLPRRQQETQARHSSPPHSPHCAPTRYRGPTTSANATKANAITRPSSPWPTTA